MDMDSLRIFLEVWKAGSITGAAGSHYMSQPAVGKRIALLEKELGVTLFDRGKGQARVRITPAGKSFAEIAERMLMLYDQAMELREGASRTYLTVACIRSAHRNILPRMLAYLRENHPEICLTVEDHHTSEILPLLEDRRIDAGITQAPAASRNLESELLYEEEYRAVLRSGSGFPPDRAIPLEALPAEHGIFQAFDAGFQDWFDEHWPLYSAKVRVNTTSAAELYFDHPADWMIVPAASAAELCRRGFESRTVENPPPARRVYLVYNRYQERPAVKLFVRQAKAFAAAPPAGGMVCPPGR